MVKVQIKKLNSKVKLPKYKTDGSSGVDLHAFLDEGDISINPNSSKIIPTGLAVAIPMDCEIQVRPRSDLAANFSISILNTPGTIDSDYRGEIKVILFNHGNKSFKINNNDRVAQMILTPIMKMDLEETNELPESIRGSGGFGSTGK